ncbi:MAG: sodium:solute symporter family protein [Candidatus Hydrogenedentes bacterium]|nr:sodium:solute symporter family protein [Candidatus Hydrogenedentota bacterium]
MTWMLAAVLGYVVLQLIVGALASFRTRNEDEYLLAGRRLGFPMIVMTVFATWFGAETCIGASGAIYAEGLSGSRADPFGYALCIFVMGIFFATVLWRRKLTTIADVFRTTYGPGVEKLGVLLMAPTSVLWAAAQIRAFGQVLSASSDLSVSVAITVAAVVVIVYTVMGGLLADAVTDFLQGIVLVIGLAVLCGALLFTPIDGESLRVALAPERLSFWAEGEPLWARLEAWTIPIIGSLFAQELVSRILAAKTPRVARSGALTAGTVYFLVGLMPVTLGLLGPALAPGLEDPEQLLPTLAQHLLHPVLYVVFAGGLISAILSTVDSTLLAAAALTSHNFVIPVLRVEDERHKVRVARIFVVIFGLVAYLMAQYAEGVYALVEEASAFGSAGLFVVILFALATRLGGARSAAASLVCGVAAYVYFGYLTGSAYPFLISLASSAAAYLFTSFFDARAAVPSVESPRDEGQREDQGR